MTRPPNDRSQGRKPISKDGELMKSRPLRMTDAEWEDAKFVGPQAIRDFVTRRAKKLRESALLRMSEIDRGLGEGS